MAREREGGEMLVFAGGLGERRGGEGRGAGREERREAGRQGKKLCEAL